MNFQTSAKTASCASEFQAARASERGRITPNKAETIENTGTPNHPRSKLLHCHRFC